MRKYDHIVLCGSVSIDRIMSFSGEFKEHIHTDKMEVLSLSLLMEKLIISNGGIAGNIAYSLALLKTPASVLASVGIDAKEYMASLEKQGVDVSCVYWSKLPTSSFTVMTDRKENQIGGFYPGAMKDNAKLSLKKWHKSKTLVVISANDPEAMRKQVRECQLYSLPYLYDVSQQVSNIPAEDILEGISNAQMVIVNDYEREVIVKRTGLTPQKMIAKTPIFITTHGEKGSTIEGGDFPQKIAIKAAKPIKVVDPTGAGDAYRAGFLAGLNQGLTIEKCATYGAVVASFAVEKQGTQLHSFTNEEFKNRLAQLLN